MPAETKPIESKLWFGVDWGTHSSKWTCLSAKGENAFAGEIHSSTLVRAGDQLIFPRGEDIPDGDERIDGLKGIIIRDPLGQSFWEADRVDTHSSLGEAVSFSFCSLLGDIVQKLKARGIHLTPGMDIEIGFSLPNWVRGDDKKSKHALIHFHQAAKVSCWVFKETYGNDLPSLGTPFLIKDWKRRVKDALKHCGVDDIPVLVEKLTKPVDKFDNVKWSYLVESCAAGLPYLRSIITAINRDAPPGLSGLGKLLVIDIGAGSTDVGYMLRTISTRRSENLFYFPPAMTFGVAGNELTQRLWEYYQQQGKRLTQEEAENLKLSAAGWHNLEFANEWRQQIRRHVKEYVKGIPDKRWLPTDVPLQVIVTGGSGVVPGLKDEIIKGVYDGLEQQGISKRIIKRAKLINERLPAWPFRQEVEYARRAVSIGAGDTNKPALKYCPNLDKPTRVEPVITRY